MLRLPHNRRTRLQFALILAGIAAFYYAVSVLGNRFESGHDFLELQSAINKNDLDRLKRHIRASAHVDVRNSDTGETALHVAVERNNIEAAKILLERGADPNAQRDTRQTPLHYAAGASPALVKLLLDQGASTESLDIYDLTPLHRAAAVGNMETIRLLVDHGAPLHTWADTDNQPFAQSSPAIVALRLGHIDVANYILFDAGKGDLSEERLDYLLDAAAGQNLTDLVRRFIEAGADPNAIIHGRVTRTINEFRTRGIQDLCTPVLTAISTGSLQALEILVEFGATLSDDQHYHFIPILELATMRNNPDMVAFLIENGLDPNYATDQKYTALHGTAKRNTPDSARALIEHGADVDARNAYGITPVWLAIEGLNPQVLKVLLEGGANPDIPDATGASPIAMARKLLLDLERNGEHAKAERAQTILDLLESY